MAALLCLKKLELKSIMQIKFSNYIHFLKVPWIFDLFVKQFKMIPLVENNSSKVLFFFLNQSNEKQLIVHSALLRLVI